MAFLENPNVSTLLDAHLATLKSLLPSLEAIKSDDPSINVIKSVLTVLTAQVIEVKTKVLVSSSSVDESFVRSVKTEQYSRRNTMVLVGLAVDPSESADSVGNLPSKVAETLSKESGVTIKPKDLSAVHRNRSNNNARNTRSKSSADSASVTVALIDSNLKDQVLQKFSNFDVKLKKSKSVRLYQSLSFFYTKLKQRISASAEAKYGKGGKDSLRWIHWRSQTSGFVLKFNNGKMIRGVFTYEDFDNQFKEMA